MGFLLVLCSLFAFTLAGFLFNPLVGLVVLGASLMYVAWILSQPGNAGGGK